MKTTNKQYDYTGLSSSRIVANFLRWKALPFGFLEKGPGVVWLLTIMVRHRFGRLLATLQIKHPEKVAKLHALVRKIKP